MAISVAGTTPRAEWDETGRDPRTSLGLLSEQAASRSTAPTTLLRSFMTISKAGKPVQMRTRYSISALMAHNSAINGAGDEGGRSVPPARA